MFTGLTSDIGIVSLLRIDKAYTYKITTNLSLDKIKIGSSIMCSGICLTATEIGKDYFLVDLSEETLDLTTAKKWIVGTKLNLECSLKVGDELGGHFVSGHVDGCIKLIKKEKLKGSYLYEFYLPSAFCSFICTKGSVAIDGVSLTINKVLNKSFQLNIIPHTFKKTTLSELVTGDLVNFEVDMLARYAVNNTRVINESKINED